MGKFVVIRGLQSETSGPYRCLKFQLSAYMQLSAAVQRLRYLPSKKILPTLQEWIGPSVYRVKRKKKESRGSMSWTIGK